MPLTETVGNYWQERQKELENHLNTEDFNKFLTWWEVGITMYVGHFPFIDMEFALLRNKRPHWIDLIQEPGIGGVAYYPGTVTSPNLIHQAYHLMLLEDTLGITIAGLKSIVEFGAGYGAMRWVASRLGFEGDYYIYDVPVYSRLQQMYLAKVWPNLLDKTHWVDTLPTEPDLFLAMWSLSESPTETREAKLGEVKPRYWLFGYQEHFEGVHNPTWFEGWVKHRSKFIDWHWIASPLAENYYLIGDNR